MKLMTGKKLRMVLLILGVILMISATNQTREDVSYSVSWWTVDGGGGYSNGGNFTIAGTIGQSETGPVMSDGNFTIVGGYWSGGALKAQSRLYLPILTR